MTDSKLRQRMATLHRKLVSRTRGWWSAHGNTALRLAVLLMAVVAAVWLSYQFWRLLWQTAPSWRTTPTGAIDLKILHRLVQLWFVGQPVYPELPGALYPPASYAMLWPFLGWLQNGYPLINAAEVIVNHASP